MHSLIDPIKTSLDILLEVKSAWETSLKECQEMKSENQELCTRIERVEIENKKLSDKVSHLEDKLLEGNVIFQGIPESMWKPSETTKEKVLSAISHTISGETLESRMNQARQIPIKDVKCIGKYAPMRTRPALVEFYHKSNAKFLLSNRTHLPKGVFIDHQYSEETERERRCLQPILHAARKSETYKGKCKMEGSTLIIKGRNYTSSNLHQLPEDINGYCATSRIDEDEKVFFWRVKSSQ